jgi:coenzyme F420-reducing hydrogenase beta subunit
MRLFSNSEKCCGCTACKNVCPRRAIFMESDEKGFLYPHIDPMLCVECGLCRKVCPFSYDFSTELNLPQPGVYAVKHKSDQVRMQSSSGGMFTAVSHYVLEQGGTVYGAAFNADFSVSHQRAESAQQSDLFRGSKYIQSDLVDTFQDVKTDLKNGRYVLFSGTPCQTAGLYSYLKNSLVDMENLILCDLVCHGVPSPEIFQQYLKYIKKKYVSDITSMTFRYKPIGWKAQAIDIEFENKANYISPVTADIFYQLFLRNIILRDSCYKCPFANLRRPSDLTLGDFWGIENCMPDFEDSKGISIVLVNTEKGKRIFSAVSDSLNCRPVNTLDYIQPNLRHPSIPSSKREAFWEDYQNHGFGYVARKYADAGLKGRVKNIVKEVLNRLGLYNIVRKLLRKS